MIEFVLWTEFGNLNAILHSVWAQGPRLPLKSILGFLEATSLVGNETHYTPATVAVQVVQFQIDDSTHDRTVPPNQQYENIGTSSSIFIAQICSLVIAVW